jgi:hypothetical protein
MFQNISIINPGFMEGKSPISNNKKKGLSNPACCENTRWPYNENYFTLRLERKGGGGVLGILVLEGRAS